MGRPRDASELGGAVYCSAFPNAKGRPESRPLAGTRSTILRRAGDLQEGQKGRGNVPQPIALHEQRSCLQSHTGRALALQIADLVCRGFELALNPLSLVDQRAYARRLSCRPHTSGMLVMEPQESPEPLAAARARRARRESNRLRLRL